MGFGTFLKGTLPGLAQTGLGIATGNPFLIGSGAAGALGGGLAAAGSRTRMNGPTDAEIARMLGASRRAQSAQIAAGERAGARQVASQAAQGGTLESGLAGRGFQDVRGAAGMQRAALEADLSRQGMAALASRTYSPDVTPLGAAGMALTQIASPIQQLGMNILTQKYLPKATKTNDSGGGAPSTSGGNAAGGAPTSTASQAPLGPPRGGAPLPLFAQASQGLGGMVPQAPAQGAMPSAFDSERAYLDDLVARGHGGGPERAYFDDLVARGHGFQPPTSVAPMPTPALPPLVSLTRPPDAPGTALYESTEGVLPAPMWNAPAYAPSWPGQMQATRSQMPGWPASVPQVPPFYARGRR